MAGIELLEIRNGLTYESSIEGHLFFLTFPSFRQKNLRFRFFIRGILLENLAHAVFHECWKLLFDNTKKTVESFQWYTTCSFACLTISTLRIEFGSLAFEARDHLARKIATFWLTIILHLQHLWLNLVNAHPHDHNPHIVASVHMTASMRWVAFNLGLALEAWHLIKPSSFLVSQTILLHRWARNLLEIRVCSTTSWACITTRTESYRDLRLVDATRDALALHHGLD